MPWCDSCSKFWNPPSMEEGGRCPTCHAVITAPPKKAPWHFKFMLVGLIVYLSYRLYQLVAWLPHHL